jgi:deoxyribodipyrimidine photolyase
LIEAVTALRSNLRSIIGGELLVRTGDPAIIVPQIAQSVKATELVFGEEPGTHERQLVQPLQNRGYYYYLDDDDDANGSYVQKWIPALCGLENAEAVFRPWDYYDLPGFDAPIVDPKSQYTWQDVQHMESTGKLLETNESIIL